MAVITEIEAVDVRFPTSRELDGSDAMNPEPDYSAAYVTLRTSDGQEGYGLAFTVGRGNDVQVAAIEALAPLVVGMPMDDVLADLGAFSRRLTGDSQLRWLGPHKGVIHMAAAAIVNAAWDLYARCEGKPVWQLLAEMSPEQLVRPRRLPLPAGCPHAGRSAADPAPGRARTDATPSKACSHGGTRRTPPHRVGWATRTRSWCGLSRQAVADGFDMIKLKVGADRDIDLRRLRPWRARRSDLTCVSRSTPTRRGASMQAIGWLEPLAAVRPVLDRGAHLARRRARARRDPQGGDADQGRHRRARATTR